MVLCLTVLQVRNSIKTVNYYVLCIKVKNLFRTNSQGGELGELSKGLVGQDGDLVVAQVTIRKKNSENKNYC